jgi:uncharacterized protein (TIGR01319 family)
MSAAVLTDFGSTVCKVTVVDLADARVLGHGEAPTYLTGDVMDAYDIAYEEAVGRLAKLPPVSHSLAASSAGGGLRMASVGLIAELTAEAARRAALTAGARLELVLTGDLGPEDTRALNELDPEILLFCGGTDGGQVDQVIAAAQTLATGTWTSHVIVACNRDIADDVAAIFSAGHRNVSVVDNVLPSLRDVNIGPARQEVLTVFLEHVITGKRLSARPDFADSVVAPTPEAVLWAAQILARGTPSHRGFGSVMVVDIGGATTDVHSVTAEAQPARGRRRPLLPIATESRSVSGDLGMRAGAPGVVLADRAWLTQQLIDPPVDFEVEANLREQRPDWIAVDTRDRRIEELFAIACAAQATMRHCGREAWALARHDDDPQLVVTGPDLRDVGLVIGTGGALVHCARGVALLGEGIDRAAERHLSPQGAQLRIDTDYVLAAGGLLSVLDGDLAAKILTGVLTCSQSASRDPKSAPQTTVETM